MFDKLNTILNNENGFCNPTIIFQLPLIIMLGNIMFYWGIYGADFYKTATTTLF